MPADVGTTAALAWQPIATAPKDGTPFWAWLYQTGIRKLKWMTETEVAALEGGEPEEWRACFVECANNKEAWAPDFWMPAEAIIEPVIVTAETARPDRGTLHILPQDGEHGDAFIVGTPSALRFLRNAIDLALHAGVAVVEGGTVTTDGEGYWLTVHAVAPEMMEGVPLPYAQLRDEGVPEWLNEFSMKAVKALLRRRQAPEDAHG